MTGVTTVYPQYIARSDKVLTIEDRINGFFQRCMNGKPLPYNSDEMRAMVAHLTYIATNRPWLMKNDTRIAKKVTCTKGTFFG
ncbi:hypothetical protein HP567_008085 [Brevibacillus sp. M2.1A]|nr:MULTISPECIES: hypothetical protein [Brevibacillus]MCC8434510.1 hypothetical protein [Brevibacillus sp. M2.1A]